MTTRPHSRPEVRPLPDGRPGEHKGIGHTLKHFLAPAEVWEDLLEDAPDELRPSVVVQRWEEPAPWEHYDAPPAEVQQDWERLRSVYRVGYLPLVEESLARLGPPSHDDGPWVWYERRWRAADPEHGVVIYLRGKGDPLRLHTAYRPAPGFTYRQHDQIPRSAEQRELRRKLMAHQGRKLMGLWRTAAAREEG